MDRVMSNKAAEGAAVGAAMQRAGIASQAIRRRFEFLRPACPVKVNETGFDRPREEKR